MSLSLNQLVDQYYWKREDRLQADKYAAELASQEYALKMQLIEAMRESELDVVGTTDFQFTRRTKQRIVPADWQLIYGFVYENQAGDLLQRRINEAAVFERMDSGILVPGTTISEYDELSRPQKVKK